MKNKEENQPKQKNKKAKSNVRKKRNNYEGIKETVLEEYKKGNIVVAGIEGLQTMPLKEFVKQPVDGMLYDLNRNEAVVLTFIEDPKWVNDYAVAMVIHELKAEIERLNIICIMADVPDGIREGLSFPKPTEEDKKWAKEALEELKKSGV